MAIDSIDEYDGDVPIIGQDAETFSQNAQDCLTFQAALPPKLNTMIEQLNQFSGPLIQEFATTALMIAWEDAAQGYVGVIVPADGSPRYAYQHNGGTAGTIADWTLLSMQPVSYASPQLGGDLDLNGNYIYNSTDSSMLQAYTEQLYVGGDDYGAVVNIALEEYKSSGRLDTGVVFSSPGDATDIIFGITKNSLHDYVKVSSASDDNYLYMSTPLFLGNTVRRATYPVTSTTYTITNCTYTYTFLSSDATTVTLGSDLMDTAYSEAILEMIIPAASTKTIVNSTGYSFYHVAADGTKTTVASGDSVTAGTYNKFIILTTNGDYNVLISQ